METIRCDITGKEIKSDIADSPVPNMEVFYIADKTISLQGKQKLDDTVDAEMKKKDKFSFSEYKNVYRKQLDKLCAGKK